MPPTGSLRFCLSIGDPVRDVRDRAAPLEDVLICFGISLRDFAMGSYGEPQYWNTRYHDKNTQFDWYLTYRNPRVRDLLRKQFKDAESKILQIGCGNSRLAEQLHEDGFKHVTSVDISEVVIAQMKERCASKPELVFDHQDVRKLDFNSEYFDVAIDKGTMDSLLCGEDSFTNVHEMLKEVSRVLVPGGVFVVVSYGLPTSRLVHLEKPEFNWTAEHFEIDKEIGAEDKGTSYHVYVLTKKRIVPVALPADDDDH